MAVDIVQDRVTGVIHESCRDRHEDERRLLTSIFNGDFTAQQVKILEVKRDSVLGEHYHLYQEMFYLLRGRTVTVELQDIESKRSTTLILAAGERLVIPPKVAHTFHVTADVVLIACTDQKYTGHDHPYHPEWLP